MEAVSKILVSSSELITDKKGLKDLKDGQILSARVIRNLSARTAELQIFGKKIPVRTFIPLLTGTEVRLMVSKKGDEVSLRLQDSPESPRVASGTNGLKAGMIPDPKSQSVGVRLHSLKSLGKPGPFGNLIKLLDVLKQKDSSGGAVQAQDVQGSGGKDDSLKLSVTEEGPGHVRQTDPSVPGAIRGAMAKGAAGERSAWVKSGTVKPDGGGPPGTAPAGSGDVSMDIKSLLNAAVKGGAAESQLPPSDAAKTENVILKGQAATEAPQVILSRESGREFPDRPEKVMAARVKNPRASMDLQGEKNENLIKLIDRAMGEMSLKSDKPDTGLISRVIRNSGLEFENNLSAIIDSPHADRRAMLQNLGEHDLKAVALKILASPEAEGSELGRSASGFLDSLENMQSLNRETFTDLGRVLLPLPVDYGELIRFGQLFIDLGKDDDSGRSKDQRLIKVSFLLEMTELGDLRADFSILKKGISGVFGATSREACTLIEESLPELTANLARHDFQVHKIDCRLLSRHALAGTTLADELVAGDEEGLLNIVI